MRPWLWRGMTLILANWRKAPPSRAYPAVDSIKVRWKHLVSLSTRHDIIAKYIYTYIYIYTYVSSTFGVL